RFALLSALAVGLWAPLLVGLATLFGEGFSLLFEDFRRRALPALALALALYLLVRLALQLSTWRGRRLALSRWRRLTRWEFWPMWAFYPPVVLYVIWLALRHRSVTLLTCVNPGIPGGGVAGESKAAILAGLARGSDRVAPFRLLRAHELNGDGERNVAAAMAALETSWPVVLKPDVGERGSGVAIVRSPEMLRRYLAGARGDVIVQRYMPGVEAGIFYYRLPGEARGHVFAITEKRLPAVVGDGRRTLEELILADDRAVCHAALFLRRHEARLQFVPARGEPVMLVELGTHSRGATFFDGAWLQSPALEAAVDRVSAGYPGFFFGRYDVRAPSWHALRQGEFTVIELNGATAEATSIYDPANGLLAAWRTLMRQWAILFEIAARNRRHGAEPTTIRELLGMLAHHRDAVAGHARP
ncbi:MAG TPA: hypothetical protein VFX50_11110, partial [Gemmatimonadales bacterium]|nr:hypothetical protein [Gemmatimonadales bacterium]